jgi:hypothetical protein
MLGPHLLQESETGASSHALGGLLVQCGLEQMPAICSHLCAQGVLCLLTFRKALQLKAMHRAIKPIGTADRKEPVWVHFGNLIQSCSQALSHAFQATQPSHVRQHKGRVGALLASGFEPAMMTAHLQKGLQQAILR